VTVALVTGAGQGIGRAIALRLAAEGASLVLTGRTPGTLAKTSALIARAGGAATVQVGDVGDPDAVAALAEAAGAVDVLVNNSGIAGPTKPLWELTPQEWEATMRVNVTGVFLMCRAFLPAMIERGSGSVVVIGSMTGKRPLPGRTPYAASKTALIGLVRTLAHEAGPHGVRVNLVSPGPIGGPRLEAVAAAQARSRGIGAGEVLEAMRAESPLARITAAEDVADAVAFLASPAAKGVTGEDLNVSSGLVMHG
jgi:NAD(P)-dependent dehydrogenase (short-subunit alcohol dehydrogenase family)